MVPSPSVPTRRSTRTAARNAAALIAEELAPQRSSTRLASLLSVSESAISNGNGGMPVMTTTVVTTTTTTRRRNPNPNSSLIAASSGSMENLSPEKRRPSRSAARGMESPIVLLDDDSVDEMDLKPAAVAAIAVAEITAVVVEKPPEDFICPICLDAPDCMTEVATINGCTHRFCFDCVDKWAGTENRCPCCKARFQTIDRVIALPPSPSALGQGRRGKRKRDRGSSSSSPRSVRVNSRNVEDRNQQSMTVFTVDAAMVHQILSTFMLRGGAGPLGGNITFDTSEDGRPQIRMVHPGNGMIGVLEMIVSEASGAGARGGGGLARASSSAIGSNNPSISRIRSPRSGSGQPPMAAAGATSAGGPSAAANGSAFARLFASLRSPGNSPGVSANAGATTNRGTPSGSPPMGMTIRFSRPAASTTGRSTVVERQSRPPSRSSTLRSAFVAVGGNGEEDSEPIVID